MNWRVVLSNGAEVLLIADTDEATGRRFWDMLRESLKSGERLVLCDPHGVVQASADGEG
jgi:hypothetical protein